MHPTLGTRLQAALAATPGSAPAHRFGELPVLSALHAGDGGTFACHVRCEVAPGTWALYRIDAVDLSAIVAAREGSEPIRWAPAGAIVIDTAVGAFIPLAAAADIEVRGDDIEDFALDTIDEALFGSDADEAIVVTPGGHAMAVFRMIGDGSYGVVEGRDADAALCALAVIQWDEADTADTASDEG
jgi:hypothetical protein